MADIDYDKLSDSVARAVAKGIRPLVDRDYGYSDGDKGTSGRGKRGKYGIPTGDSGEVTWDDFPVNPISMVSSAGGYLMSLVGSLGDFQKRITDTIGMISLAATEASNVMGTGLRNYEAITQEIAKILPDLTRLGLDAREIGEIQSKFTNNIHTNVILTAESLKDIAILKELGADGERLAMNFRLSGQSLRGMARELETSLQVAADYGVNTSVVLAGVQKMMETTDQYRFQNGVEGMSKMAAHAAVLHVSMDSIVGLAKQIQDPQGAIEMVSKLQVLGLTMNELQDPFQVMFMAQNDLEGLTNAISDSVGQLATFNRETGKMEIPFEARRTMQELQGILGMSAQEMNSMVHMQARLNEMSGDFEGLGFSDEDQQMIASLAEWDEKRGEFTIKVNHEDTEGKTVAELLSTDLEKLRERPKTLEDAAMQQLGFVESINNSVLAIAQSLVSPMTGTRTQLDMERINRSSSQAVTSDIVKIFETANVRKGLDDFTRSLMSAGGDIKNAFKLEDFGKLDSLLGTISDSGAASFNEVISKFKTGFADAAMSLPDKIDSAINDDNIFKPLSVGMAGIMNDLFGKIKGAMGLDEETPTIERAVTTARGQHTTHRQPAPPEVLNENLEKLNQIIDDPERADEILNRTNEIIRSIENVRNENNVNNTSSGAIVPVVNISPDLEDNRVGTTNVERENNSTREIREILGLPTPETGDMASVQDNIQSLTAAIESTLTPANIIAGSDNTTVTNVNNLTNRSTATVLPITPPVINNELAVHQGIADQATPKEITVKFDPFIVKLEGDGRSMEMVMNSNVFRDKIINMVGEAMTSDYGTKGNPILVSNA